MNDKLQLKTVHWNSFKLNEDRIFELSLFLKVFKPHLMSINEVKLSREKANLFLRFDEYNTIYKPRKENPNEGGGVCILIREGINYHELGEINDDDEMIGVNIDFISFQFKFYSLYVPPDKLLSYTRLAEISKSEFLLVGDLNAKSECIGCKTSNQSGKVLDNLILLPEFNIINNKDHTYFKFKSNYSELLDLAICSSEINSKISNFEVLTDQCMGSDHCPITFTINLGVTPLLATISNSYQRLNLAKADWEFFGEILTRKALLLTDSYIESLNVEEFNQIVSDHIMEAANTAIPVSEPKVRRTFRPNIVNLIKEIRFLKKDMKYLKSEELRKVYNKLTNKIRSEIRKHNEYKWVKFLDKFGAHPVSTRPFWKEINKTRSSKTSVSIPTLESNGMKLKTDCEKAEVFASLLGRTFSSAYEEDDFDCFHHYKVNEAIDKYKKNYIYNNDAPFEFNHISMTELKKRISKLKVNCSPGADTISNIFFKKMPETYRYVVLKLINLSIKTELPQAWRQASITMIPKKGKPSDPTNYRPISLTSCLGKLAERTIKERLYKYLELNNILLKQQSGFRNNRGASDNLILFTQKISEAFNEDKKACGIFFDISKAFDRVWHNGLLFKMIKLKTPLYIIRFVTNFLNKREFIVKVNNYSSKSYPIECGLPQGSVLAPLLFSIFINDIPLATSPNSSHSTLYADDLGSLFLFKKPGNIEVTINNYLDLLSAWLFEWRLKMNTDKCNYVVFSKGNSNIKFNLRLNNKQIGYQNNPLFLGIIFDKHLNFNLHYESLRKRALSRLNIIKIFSHKSWHLNHKTLLSIFTALVGSIFDYSFFTLANVSKTKYERVQRIQNTAVKCIFKLPRRHPSSELNSISQLLPFEQRHLVLGCRYVTKALNKNAFISELVKEYLSSIYRIHRKGNINGTPLCCIMPIITIVFIMFNFLLAKQAIIKILVITTTIARLRPSSAITED